MNLLTARCCRAAVLAAAVLVASIPARLAIAQGSLTPPGPPAPTMKSLDQVEPRIDLFNAPAAAVTTTNANYHFIITQPGSYYLSANLGVTKANGIQINVEGVTVDLKGFQISRASGTGGTGVEIPVTSHRACVFNGSITGFAYGVRSLFSAPSFARACAFRDLAVSSCTVYGILAGQGAVLETCRAYANSGGGIGAGTGCSLANCTASNNAGSFAISADVGSSLTNCTASNNTTFFGISTGFGCSLTNCTASNNTVAIGISAGGGSALTNCTSSFNTSAASVSVGVDVGDASSIINCTASNNTTTNPTHTATTGEGFGFGSRSTVQGCTASNNSGDGFSFVGACLITGNNASNNGLNGFHVNGTGTTALNRIDGNLAVANGAAGILWANDFVARNVSFNNTPNYSPGVGANNTGPVQSAGSATNPFANF